MSEQWEIGSEVSAEDYTQCAIYCNQQGDRHIEQQNATYLVVANTIPSQASIATGNNENTGDSMEHLFGDGSDGNVTLETDTNFDEMKNFRNFTLSSGVNLSKTTGCSPLVIRCKETCTIAGTISMTGKGYTGSSGAGLANGYGSTGSLDLILPGISINARNPSGSCDKTNIQMLASIFDFGSIPWCGGGGAGSVQTRQYGYTSSSYQITHSEEYGTPGIGAGSGGNGGCWYSGEKKTGNGTATSTGGTGGGGVLIIANRIIITGTINANGTNGNLVQPNGYYVAYGGGGGGGTVVLLAKQGLEITGNVNCAGGASGGGNAGAGGNGCFVSLII